MANLKTKLTVSEFYSQTYNNIKTMLEHERDWLESGKCSDIQTQHRLVSNLEGALAIFQRCQPDVLCVKK
jgi:hypothetical protein